MGDQQRIADALRELADGIEDGDIHVKGSRFDRPTLSGENQEWTLIFDNTNVMEWNRQFWEAARPLVDE